MENPRQRSRVPLKSERVATLNVCDAISSVHSWGQRVRSDSDPPWLSPSGDADGSSGSCVPRFRIQFGPTSLSAPLDPL